MPLSIGVNLRVTGHCNQGGRKYMEDMFSVAYQQTSDDKDLEYAFFGIFDGHGGGEAATFAKEHLMDIIVKQKNFWSDRDEDVLRAIRDGYVNTHYAMWRELDKWPRTASGLPSTAGTTASIAFIRKGKIYIGHVGDSGIVLGYQDDGDPQWKAKALTKDHKPESGPEMSRIQESGGKVVSKSGVPRVVWNRPRIGHKGPVRRSTHIDEIPFLAVARSLGDLWSYNSELDTFVVSPEPDVRVVAVDVKSHRCLIFGTDGLWNMLTAQAAVAIVQAAERHNEKHLIASQQAGTGQTDVQMWINPSKSLVDRALERWFSTRLRADNTSVVTLMLDPPGPSRSEVLLSQKKEQVPSPKPTVRPVFYTPVPTTPIQTPQKPLPCSGIPHVLQKNPPKGSIEVEGKQPDSSNTTEESSNKSTPAENVIPKETDPLMKCMNDVNFKSTEIIALEDPPEDGTESIQVAEISSSDILDEIKEVEGSEIQDASNETSTNQEKNVKTSEESATRQECESKTESSLQKVLPQKMSDPKMKEENSKVPNIVRENAFSDMCDEVKSSTTSPSNLTSRLRRGGAANKGENTFNRPCDDVRGGVLNGTRRKHSTLSQSSSRSFGGAYEHDLRGAARRRHSMNIQPENVIKTNSDGDLRTTVLNGTRRRPGNHPFGSTYEGLLPGATGEVKSSRLKHSTTKTLTQTTFEETRTSITVVTRTNGTVASKRRHSTISQAQQDSCTTVVEPSIKRRTRSEDRRSPTDENNPVNQKREEPHSRLGWPGSESSLSRANGTSSSTTSGQERLSSPNSFQRRSLEKKATPVKTFRRPSINGANRVQLRGSFGLRDYEQAKSNRSVANTPSTNGICADQAKPNRTICISPTDAPPQRWLRSDTIAATPVKTLRSRNVDITGHTVSAQVAHQYGVVKQNRLSLPAKLKQAAIATKIKSPLSTGKLKQAGLASSTGTSSGAGSGIAKRAKSPYNPSARSLSTRSRIKRLGK
ncbi:uncharacterized protein LOC107270053 [Cephus cinctus]|uniref:Uncharacterized protein LOC107270053 n=1 Tax=Cephus cinctus TaxID=211228 RepID=A0AAJ7C298_CEPCN|nr:uncharacterized protein LOC107270053 [Cephus cinctus]XP_024943296.1 uncharacterized protein LOC107270053 [Cephus cinctus]